MTTQSIIDNKNEIADEPEELTEEETLLLAEDVLDGLTDEQTKVLELITEEGVDAPDLRDAAWEAGVQHPLTVIKSLVNHPNGLVNRNAEGKTVVYSRLR